MKRLPMNSVSRSVAQAINCIVSKPFDIGRWPETIQRSRSSSEVWRNIMTVSHRVTFEAIFLFF